MSDNDSSRFSDDGNPEIFQENEKNPEWDGSEAEFVSDDDAEEYEIPETGIKISYILTEEELYKCLYHSDLFKTKGTRAIIQSIVLAAASVIFFVIYFTTKSEYSVHNLFFGIICLVMIALLWLVPHFHIKSLAKMLADGKLIEAEIYPTHIDIGQGEGAWTIELDGKAKIEEFDNIFMIYADKDKSFAIPERVIEPELYNEIRAILMSGTQPAED